MTWHQTPGTWSSSLRPVRVLLRQTAAAPVLRKVPLSQVGVLTGFASMVPPKPYTLLLVCLPQRQLRQSV